MSQKDLTAFKALTFDIIGALPNALQELASKLIGPSCMSSRYLYGFAGTLVDYETGVINFFRPKLEAAGRSATDNEILEVYARAEKKNQVYQFPGGVGKPVLFRKRA